MVLVPSRSAYREQLRFSYRAATNYQSIYDGRSSKQRLLKATRLTRSRCAVLLHNNTSSIYQPTTMSERQRVYLLSGFVPPPRLILLCAIRTRLYIEERRCDWTSPSYRQALSQWGARDTRGTRNRQSQPRPQGVTLSSVICRLGQTELCFGLGYSSHCSSVGLYKTGMMDVLRCELGDNFLTISLALSRFTSTVTNNDLLIPNGTYVTVACQYAIIHLHSGFFAGQSYGRHGLVGQKPPSRRADFYQRDLHSTNRLLQYP